MVDCLTVLGSATALIVEVVVAGADATWLRAVRVLRALRPLRAFTYIHGAWVHVGVHVGVLPYRLCAQALGCGGGGGGGGRSVRRASGTAKVQQLCSKVHTRCACGAVGSRDVYVVL